MAGKLYEFAKDREFGNVDGWQLEELLDEAKKELNDILDAPILRNGAPSVGKRVYAWSIKWLGED